MDVPWIHEECSRVVVNDEELYTARRRYIRRYGSRKAAAEAFHRDYGPYVSAVIGETVSKTAIRYCFSGVCV